MDFYSILFVRNEDKINEEALEAPAFFDDLNINQILDAITAGRQEYNLKPFFYSPVPDIDTIRFRQEVAQDLENETLLENIKSFAHKMILTHRYLAMIEKLYYKYHQEGWFLEAVDAYCDAVNCLERDLSLATLKSRGLLTFRAYLTNYARSPQFILLQTETNQLKTELSTIKYCVNIKGSTVKVRKYELETDYSVEVEKTFEKFKQGTVKDYTVKLLIGSGMNHVEAQILDLVAKLYPEIFSSLDGYYRQHRSFLDETIHDFDREIQFYVGYLEYIAKIKLTGLKFCYPKISNADKEIFNYEGFDLALSTIK